MNKYLKILFLMKFKKILLKYIENRKITII